jgi:futalosine hydrolase
VGKVRAAAATLREIAAARPAWILQVGCGGAFPGAGLELGDVVLALEEFLADEGVETPAGFLGLEELGFAQARRGGEALYSRIPVASPSDLGIEDWEDAAAALAQSRGFRLRSGRMVTVSTASGTDARAQALEARFQPLVESMEGAAAALVAWEEGIPFLELRGVSNFTGARDRARWEVERACGNAAVAAQEILRLAFDSLAARKPHR